MQICRCAHLDKLDDQRHDQGIDADGLSESQAQNEGHKDIVRGFGIAPQCFHGLGADHAQAKGGANGTNRDRQGRCQLSYRLGVVNQSILLEFSVDSSNCASMTFAVAGHGHDKESDGQHHKDEGLDEAHEQLQSKEG